MINIPAQNEAIMEAELRIRICWEKRSRILDLSDIGLTSIPKAVKEMGNLKVLNLSENTISVLPGFIGSLKQLEYLDLSYNKLSALPQSIGNLRFLGTLNVRCNELKAIPESVGKLTLLKSLDISNNRLIALPESINDLPNLENCSIKGNSLKTLSEKITGLIKPKDLGLLGHIERIIELTGNSGLSSAHISNAKPHIDYAVKKLHITPVQAILFSHLVSIFDDDPVRMEDIARSIDCSKMKLMQHLNDFEELKHKRLIRPSKQLYRGCRQKSVMDAYRIPKEVIMSLTKEEEYRPVNQSNLSIDELFSRIHLLFEQRVRDNEICYDELSAEITELLDDNAQLPFVRKICGYELPKNDLLLLIRFCHYYINRDQEEMGFDAISAMYDHASDFGINKRLFKTGEHSLIARGFIEFANSDGFGNPELFKLTDNVKNDLLSELKVKFPCSCKEIIRCAAIKEKKLFYNEKEALQVLQLSSLLKECSFNEIKIRLSNTGMRTGFACIFHGLPGTGKTETAYQLARQTGRDIMAVDISQSKSCWFGESERIIKKIFTRYRDFVEESEVTPILLFNEADAVFGKRKDISMSPVAQTENTIQNIILQEMENLNGILIATTNMAKNLDNAFERRFLYKIEFNKPETAIRQSIWQSVIPAISGENACELARRFDFSGGQIENIARKCTVEFVLSGTEPDLNKLIIFCEEEVLERSLSRNIGFSA